jgi:enoyl-CoA hydratase/carnithine racemase
VLPEACSSWFLPRIVRISRAAEWVYSGRVFDAHEALAGGWFRAWCRPKAASGSVRARARDRREHPHFGYARARSVADARRRPPDGKRTKIDSKASTGWAVADAAEESRRLGKAQAPLCDAREQRMPPYYPWWRERPFK